MATPYAGLATEYEILQARREDLRTSLPGDPGDPMVQALHDMIVGQENAYWSCRRVLAIEVRRLSEARRRIADLTILSDDPEVLRLSDRVNHLEGELTNARQLADTRLNRVEELNVKLHELREENKRLREGRST